MPSSIHLTGVLQYKPEKCWNGFTLIPAILNSSTAKGAVLYDMNGRIVNKWKGVFGCFDNKMLPGGEIMGTTCYAPGYWLDCVNIVRKDWQNNTLWEYSGGESLPDLSTGQPFSTVRQHHDFQLEGSPCGYYIPGMPPQANGKKLLNSTTTRILPEFSPHPVADTILKIIDAEENCEWSWSLFDHWDQLGIESIGKAVHYKYAPLFGKANYVKATYCNNINWLGPNKWYDAGDERFHPDNIISDIRVLNVSFIIDHKTGNIVWRLGPDFEYDKKLQDIGQIVGQHHVHIIPRGLPGEGNVLLFDNGGQAGLGKPTPCAPTGYCNATRGSSRILEIDPVTMDVVWSFNDCNREYGGNIEVHCFENLLYSPYCSSADRLPNGNTMITEMCSARVIEVTPDREIVWEFVNPGDLVFRAHRYPYDWCPQAEKPQEVAVTPLNNSRMRITPDGKPVLMDDDDFFHHERLSEIPN